MNTSLLSTASPVPEAIPPLVVHELDLGEHLLLIRADKSMELIHLCDEAISGVSQGIALNPEEAYHLFISLKEVFK